MQLYLLYRFYWYFGCIRKLLKCNSSFSPIGTSTASSTSENTAVNTSNIPNGTMINFVMPSQQTTLSWSPFTDLYTDAAATSPYTGQDVNVVYVKPSTEITYTVTSSNGDCTSEGFYNSYTITITSNYCSEDAVICNGDTTTLTVSGADTYSWSPATGLSSTTGNTVDANPTVTTTYTVTGTSADGCQSTDTVTVTVNNPIVITIKLLSNLFYQVFLQLLFLLLQQVRYQLINGW